MIEDTELKNIIKNHYDFELVCEYAKRILSNVKIEDLGSNNLTDKIFDQAILMVKKQREIKEKLSK